MLDGHGHGACVQPHGAHLRSGDGSIAHEDYSPIALMSDLDHIDCVWSLYKRIYLFTAFESWDPRVSDIVLRFTTNGELICLSGYRVQGRCVKHGSPRSTGTRIDIEMRDEKRMRSETHSV